MSDWNLLHVPRLEEIKFRILTARALDLDTVKEGELFTVHTLQTESKVRSLKVSCWDIMKIEDRKRYHFLNLIQPGEGSIPNELRLSSLTYSKLWVLTPLSYESIES